MGREFSNKIWRKSHSRKPRGCSCLTDRPQDDRQGYISLKLLCFFLSLEIVEYHNLSNRGVGHPNIHLITQMGPKISQSSGKITDKLIGRTFKTAWRNIHMYDISNQ